MLCSVFIATSLDGFIAREDGSLGWLPAGGGEEHGYTNFIAGIDGRPPPAVRRLPRCYCL
jgi:dihydrofolate reductase